MLVDSLGLSYEEAAEAMGVALGTVKSRLAPARGEMQALLQEEQELCPRATVYSVALMWEDHWL